MATTLGQLRINIAVDTQEFDKNIETVQRNLKTATAQFKATASGTDKMKKSVSDLTADSKSLENVLKQQYIIVEKNKRAWEELSAEVGENAVKTEKAKQAYYKSVEAMNKTQNQMDRLNDEIKRLNDEAANSPSKWSKWSDSIQSFGKKTMDVGKKIRDVSGNIARDFGAMTLAVGGAFGLAAKSAADFEAQMSKVKSISGATPEEMKKLQDQAMKLGSSTQYSATQVAQAQEELLKAGVDMKTVLGDGLKGTLDLAAAGEMDLADAATLASTALNSFKDESLSTTDAANMLAGVANATAADINGLKDGLAQSSAVASVAGVSFADTTKTLGLFAQNGLKGSDAGTSLKTMLLNLSPTTKDATNQMKNLGIISYDSTKALQTMTQMGLKPASGSFEDVRKAMAKHLLATTDLKEGTKSFEKELNKAMQTGGFYSNTFYDAQGNLKGMGDISEILKDKLSNLSKEQQTQALKTMFGTDAVRAAAIMMKEGKKGYDDMTESLKKVTAADTAKTKMDNLQGTLQKLKNSFDTFKISIGNALLPVLKNLAERFQKVTDKINSLSPKQKENIAKWGLITTAVLGGVAVLGTLGVAIGGIITGFGAMATAATFLFTNPIGLGILAIGGLAVGVGVLAKKMSESTLDTDRFGEGVSAGTKKALEGYFNLSDKATEELNELKLTNQAVTEEQKTKVVGIYQSMTDEIIAKMQDRAKKEKIEAQRILLDNTSLSEAKKAQMLANMTVQAEAEQSAVRETQDKLIAIYTKAAEEKRDTTDKENREIEKLQNKLNKKAVEVMSKNEVEIKAIQERMKTTEANISAQQTADYIKKANEKTKGAVDAAEKEYNKKLEYAIKQRDETLEFSQNDFELFMKDAEKKKNASIKSAEEERNGVIKQAILKHSDYMSQIDMTTGEVVTKWGKIIGKGNDTLNKNYDTALSLGMIFNQETGKWVDLTAKKTDELKDKSNNAKIDMTKAWNDLKPLFGTVADSITQKFGGINLFETGKNIIGGLLKGMEQTDIGKTVLQVGNAVTKTFKSVFDIKSPSVKMKNEVGQWITKGIGQGMLDHIDVVENASRQVSKVVQIQGTMNGAGVALGNATNNSYTNNITIQGGNNAQEIARHQQLLLRRLQFQGGIPR